MKYVKLHMKIMGKSEGEDSDVLTVGQEC